MENGAVAFVKMNSIEAEYKIWVFDKNHVLINKSATSELFSDDYGDQVYSCFGN
jgi:hypothetical protein